MSQIKITYAMSDADADDKKLHNRLIDLLEAVDRHGSLAAAWRLNSTPRIVTFGMNSRVGKKK